MPRYSLNSSRKNTRPHCIRRTLRWIRRIPLVIASSWLECDAVMAHITPTKSTTKRRPAEQDHTQVSQGLIGTKCVVEDFLKNAQTK